MNYTNNNNKKNDEMLQKYKNIIKMWWKNINNVAPIQN